MRKIPRLLFPLLFVLKTSAFGGDPTIINGQAHLNNTEYDALTVNGDLTFQDLVVKNSIVINGRVQGKHLKCHTMTSNGSVDVDGLEVHRLESRGSFSADHIDVKGLSKFNGDVHIKNGKLQNLQIISTKSILTDTTVCGKMNIQKVKRGMCFLWLNCKKSWVPILELKGNSLVKGDITFEEEGEVHLFEGAKIKGKVVNAKVVQK